jgi:UDPglucose 6-dehydrogenase
MKICTVGTGYVGLVVGTCFAESGHSVWGIDADASKIEALQAGRIPIYEPGLTELVQRNMEEGRLTFSTDLAPAVQASEVIFIAVGTPQDEDGSADLKHVLAVADAIANSMDGFKIVVLKSTVPVGTNARVTELIRSKTSHPFEVVSNPEFLKEGTALDDFMYPDRVVIGTLSDRAAETMLELYTPFVQTGKPILRMDPPSAEMTKYAANAMLASRISFMNEIARICERVGANVHMIRQGIGSDSRIGHSFLFPGPGYGGSCFPKDVQALIRTAYDHGYDFRIGRATEEVNAEQKRYMIPKIVEHFRNEVAGKRIAVWGLAFKPKTDDMREAPAITMVRMLLELGADVRAFDPEAMEEAKRVFGDAITYWPRALDALDGADALLLVTEWNEFRRPDYAEMKRRMTAPVIFDCRNILEVRRLRQHGFTYHGIGVPSLDNGK